MRYFSLFVTQAQRYNRTVVTPLPSPNDYHLPLLVKEKNSSTSVHSQKSRIHRSSPINYSHICVPCPDMRLNSSVSHVLMCLNAILHTACGSPLPMNRGGSLLLTTPVSDHGSPPTTPVSDWDSSSTPSIPDTSREDSGPLASFHLEVLLGDESLEPVGITPSEIHDHIKAGFSQYAENYLWEMGFDVDDHPKTVHYDVSPPVPRPVRSWTQHGKRFSKYRFRITPGNLKSEKSREICSYCQGSLTIVQDPRAPLDYSQSKMKIESVSSTLHDTDPIFTVVEVGPVREETHPASYVVLQQSLFQESDRRFYHVDPNPSDPLQMAVEVKLAATANHAHHHQPSDEETAGSDSGRPKKRVKVEEN
ncbi:hypothetical protein F5880DRAFT_1606489 [Lentinula raphanica]|nr:hypothetical protein F5880DRAFT_1606489 [Lentinula raphanica]